MTEGTYRPADAADLEQFVRWAVAEQVPLEIAGAGSKRGFGRPATAAHRLVLDRLAQVDQEVTGLRTGSLDRQPCSSIS